MKRRDALKALALLPLIPGNMKSKSAESRLPKKSAIKPCRLVTGDTIGVISPASGVSDSTFEKGLANIAELGFNTKVGKYARGGKGFLAGTDAERLHDLHWAFSDPEINAVWCMRGGYGASRLLPQIDYKLLKRNPKILVGYSDITALHMAISRKSGLVTFHGPNAASNFPDYTKRHVEETLMYPNPKHRIELPIPAESQDPDLYRARVISKGKCKGRLTGGNLSLLSALAGTPFGLNKTKGKLLFIEDINEPPYKVDRMLTQLRQHIDMRSLGGIAVGVFTGNEPDPAEPSQSLMEVLQERLGDLGIPVLYGLSFGHIREQFMIPIGIKAEMDTSDSSLTLIEQCVS